MALDAANADVLKHDVACLLLEHPQGIKYGDFSGAFYKLHGYHPPLALHGYSSLKCLLTDMKSMVALEKNSQVIRLADGPPLNCWFDEGEWWDSSEEGWDCFEEGYAIYEEEMQSLTDEEAELSAASVSTTTRPLVHGLSAVKSRRTQGNPTNRCPPKHLVVNSFASLSKGPTNQVPDAFMLIREVIGTHPHGLKVKRLNQILKEKHEFDLAAFSVYLGYENTLAFLRDIPGLLLQKGKKVNSCVIRLQSESCSPAPSLDSDVSACSSVPQKAGGKLSDEALRNPQFTCKHLAISLACVLIELNTKEGLLNLNKLKVKHGFNLEIFRCQLDYHNVLSWLQDIPESLFQKNAFLLIQDVLQGHLSGLRLKKLKEILKAKSGFDLETFSVSWGYDSTSSCLQDIPGLLVRRCERVNNCVIQLQSEPCSRSPSLDSDFSACSSVPPKMGRKKAEVLALLTELLYSPTHVAGLKVKKLQELLLASKGFDLEKFSIAQGCKDTLEFLEHQMPELTIKYNMNRLKCVIKKGTPIFSRVENGAMGQGNSLPKAVVRPEPALARRPPLLKTPMEPQPRSIHPLAQHSKPPQPPVPVEKNARARAMPRENILIPVVRPEPALARKPALLKTPMEPQPLSVRPLASDHLRAPDVKANCVPPKGQCLTAPKTVAPSRESVRPKAGLGRLDSSKAGEAVVNLGNSLPRTAVTEPVVIPKSNMKPSLSKTTAVPMPPLHPSVPCTSAWLRAPSNKESFFLPESEFPKLPQPPWLRAPGNQESSFLPESEFPKLPQPLVPVEKDVRARAMPGESVLIPVVRPEPAVVHKPTLLKTPVEPQPRSIYTLASDHLRAPDVKENCDLPKGQCPTAPKMVAPLLESVRLKDGLGGPLDSSKVEEAAINLGRGVKSVPTLRKDQPQVEPTQTVEPPNATPDFGGISKPFFRDVTKAGLDAVEPLQNGLPSSTPVPSAVIPSHPSSKEHHGASSDKDKSPPPPHSAIPAQQLRACQPEGQSAAGKASCPADAQLLGRSSLASLPCSEPLDDLKQQVVRILATHPEGMSLFQFRAAYSAAYQHHLPLGNASSAKQCLLEMADVVCMKGYGVQTLLLPVSPEALPTKPGPPVSSRVENGAMGQANSLPKAVVRPEPAVAHKPALLKTRMEPQPLSIHPLAQLSKPPHPLAPVEKNVRARAMPGENVLIPVVRPEPAVVRQPALLKIAMKPQPLSVRPLASDHLRGPDVKAYCVLPKRQCPTAPKMVAPSQELVRPKASIGGHLDSSKAGEAAANLGNSLPEAAMSEPVAIPKFSIKPSLSTTAAVTMPPLHPSIRSTSASLRVPDNAESFFFLESVRPKGGLGGHLDSSKVEEAAMNLGDSLPEAAVREPVVVRKSSMKPSLSKTAAGHVPQPHPSVPLTSACLKAACNQESSFLPESQLPKPPKPFVPVEKNVRARAMPGKNVFIPHSPVVFPAEPQIARLNTSVGLASWPMYPANPSFSVNIPVPSLIQPVMTNFVAMSQPVVYPPLIQLPDTPANRSLGPASYQSVSRTPLRKAESVSSCLTQPVSQSGPPQPTSPSRSVEQTDCICTADGLDPLRSASGTQGQDRSPAPVFSANEHPVSSPSVKPPSLQPLQSPSVKQPDHTGLGRMPGSSVPAADDSVVSMPQPHHICVDSAVTSSSVQSPTLSPSPPGSPTSETNRPSSVSFGAGTGYDASRQSMPLPGMSREGSEQDSHRFTLMDNQRYRLTEEPMPLGARQNSPLPPSSNNCVVL